MSARLSYPAKVVVAWGEAISGNTKIRDWLISNGYPELGLFVFALHNKDEAREWLMKNGHPHLMALINGAEGNKQALVWLEQQGFDVLTRMARAVDNDDEAMEWLFRLPEREWFILAQRMRSVKNDIEFKNNDVHRFSKD